MSANCTRGEGGGRGSVVVTPPSCRHMLGLSVSQCCRIVRERGAQACSLVSHLASFFTVKAKPIVRRLQRMTEQKYLPLF